MLDKICGNPDCRRVVRDATFDKVWYAAGIACCSKECQCALLAVIGTALADAPRKVAEPQAEAQPC